MNFAKTVCNAHPFTPLRSKTIERNSAMSCFKLTKIFSLWYWKFKTFQSYFILFLFLLLVIDKKKIIFVINKVLKVVENSKLF